jgi:hypothetical protein
VTFTTTKPLIKYLKICENIKVKVKVSRYRLEQVLGDPEG